MNHSFTAIKSLVQHEMILAFRKRQDWVNPILFFIMVVCLFPLAIGPDTKILSTIAPGIIWVAALLAHLLSFDRLFRSDFEDGSLEHLLLSPQPFTLLILAKVFVHWLLTGFPLLIISPVLGGLLHLSGKSIVTLFWGLLLGTPVLSLIGSIGAALTLGLRRGGLILPVLVLPLFLPVLIFGTGAVMSSDSGLSPAGPLALIAALFALSLSLAPLATAASLRIVMSTGDQ